MVVLFPNHLLITDSRSLTIPEQERLWVIELLDPPFRQGNSPAPFYARVCVKRTESGPKIVIGIAIRIQVA